MSSMHDLERELKESFTASFNIALNSMDLDDLRGFADEDGDLDVSAVTADIIDTMDHEGETHEIVDNTVPCYYATQAAVLASRPGIGNNLDVHLGGPMDSDLWSNIAACIFFELEEYLLMCREGWGDELVEDKWPSLSVEPDVSS